MIYHILKVWKNILMKKVLLNCFLITLFSFPLSAHESLRFGVFPLYNAKVTIELFAPIAEVLSEELDITVELVTAPTQAVFRERLLRESYDIAWVNNSSYLMVSEPGSYRAAAAGYPGFHGVVMVREDSPISKIEELEGRRVAAVGDHSIAGYLFFRKEMAEKGLYPGLDYEVTFIRGIEPIPFLVVNGKYDACVFSEDTYYKSGIFDRIRDQLRIISTSIEIPQFPFILHEDVNSYLEERFQEVLSSINPMNPEGRKIMDALNINGFLEKTNDDYAEFRLLYAEIKDFSIPEGAKDGS